MPLAQEVCRAYPYEEAARLVMEATAPLGEDYAEKMRAALENRWIDVYPKDNKQTGAYSTGTYGFHPYMLLNYDNTLEDVFTLVHELGHSMHTIYSCESQPFVYSDYSIFCAEVASTVNEQLLHHYLLAHCESPALRRLLLAKHLDDLRSTFYRQTMLADFEMQTHAKVEAGEPLLPDVLCGIHAQLNRDYYGPQLVVDDTLSYEWAQNPPFLPPFLCLPVRHRHLGGNRHRQPDPLGVPRRGGGLQEVPLGRQQPAPHRAAAAGRGGYGLAPAGAGHRRGVLRDPRRAEKAALIPPAERRCALEPQGRTPCAALLSPPEKPCERVKKIPAFQAALPPLFFASAGGANPQK